MDGRGAGARDARGARGAGRREEIIRAALALFGEHGYRGTSFAMLAKRVGLTQQGVLHYFPTKERLLQEVLELRDRLDREALHTAGPVTADHDPLAAAVRLAEVNAGRRGLVQCFAGLLGDSVTEDHPAGDYFRDRYVRLRAVVEGRLRAKYGEHLPSGLPVDAAAPLLIAVFDGLQMQWLHDVEVIDMPGLVGTLARVLGAETVWPTPSTPLHPE
ncbi:TetR/AcrR family transcriptional regulator [Streptomyces sp. NPDC048603]|uniref:TetR/AcrR family transcriptional regulator n=1 Tax=Streptomyces sp. NPDC048603 TaxID=3365577 RepID=UPI003723555E